MGAGAVGGVVLVVVTAAWIQTGVGVTGIQGVRAAANGMSVALTEMESSAMLLLSDCKLSSEPKRKIQALKLI